MRARKYCKPCDKLSEKFVLYNEFDWKRVIIDNTSKWVSKQIKVSDILNRDLCKTHIFLKHFYPNLLHFYNLLPPQIAQQEIFGKLVRFVVNDGKSLN